jgi:hypothetical protein
MVVVITILAALLVAGGYALYLQLNDTKSTGYVTREREALYCAEAGLVSGRAYAAANQAIWNDLLDGDASNDPDDYPLQGDVDGDGEADFQVTIEDNHDEPGTNDPTHDNDLQVFVVSECLKDEDSPRKLMELVQFDTGGHHYRNQSGGGEQNANNQNVSP